MFCYEVVWNIQLGAASFCVFLRISALLSCLSTLSFLRQTNGTLAFLPISRNWDCRAGFSLTVKPELIGSEIFYKIKLQKLAKMKGKIKVQFSEDF